MWPHVFRPHAKHDHREAFIITPHHPDRLRRPRPSLAGTADDRFQQALIWNVFRTLELVAPPFWLRRLHMRLFEEPPPAPAQIARVHLWQRLPLPPIQRIDGARPDVTADVLIETEHAAWTLIVESANRDVTETIVAVADAGDWAAGARRHYCGVIETTPSSTSLASMLNARYTRSRESATLRSASRGPSTPTHVRWGGIGWSDLAALLQDCCEAANLPPIERALARNGLEWLTSVGVDPVPRRERDSRFQVERGISR